MKLQGLSFTEVNEHIEIIYNGNKLNLSDASESDVSYLRGRLGYNKNCKDYCVNGFALKDQLMKNSYTRELFKGPEFIQRLSHHLKRSSIISEYQEKSIYYCYTYKLNISDIMFDCHDKFNNKEKIDFFIVQLFFRLMEYTRNNHYISDNNNPIIRIADNSCILANSLINIEEIQYDMIE